MSSEKDARDKNAWLSERLVAAQVRKDRQTKEERQRQKLLEGKVMTQTHANEIATRLDQMINQRAAALRGRKAELTPRMPDTKELHRLRLPPGADPAQRRVRLSLAKYREVVRNLARICSEDPDDLLYELVQGTAYESAKAWITNWAQHNTIMSAVNATLARLDHKFDWTGLYERTANLRLKYGPKCTWPLSVGTSYFSDGESNEEMAKALADPFQVFFIQNSVSPTGGRPLLQNYFNGQILIGPEFFYVPHALIGHVCLWDLPEVRHESDEHIAQRYSHVKNRRGDDEDLQLPDDDWNTTSLSPRGQMLDLPHYELEQPFWLVVYPDPISFKPVPALYQPVDLSGDAFLAPLNRLTLAAVEDGIWMDRKRESTVAERLLVLVTEDEHGITPLERAWCRTGPWLQHNPVLKMQRQEQERLQQIYTAALKRRSLGNPD